MTDDGEFGALATHFRDAPGVFDTSPLYQTLCPVVADHRPLLELLTHRRPGQQPSFLLFGAVHYLLLDGASHPLRDYYPSVSGDGALDPTESAPAFLDFCRENVPKLQELIATRLVQSNVVRRAIGLRYAMYVVGRRWAGPVHVIEVGASAGLLLNVDRYRYRVGGREFGGPAARVTLDCDWRGSTAVPDLDAIPQIASKVGVDPYPVDIDVEDQRRWLQALVWPEQRAAAALLDAAIKEARVAPVTVIQGDAIDVCPRLGRDLPPGEASLVFHAATRMHVPADRRRAFDAAIDSLSERGPLFHAWIEPDDAQHHGFAVDQRGVMAMHGPGDSTALPVARVDGHLHWIEPLSADWETSV